MKVKQARIAPPTLLTTVKVNKPVPNNNPPIAN